MNTSVTTKTTIMLAEDHALTRGGIRQLLEAESDLEVIGEASEGGEVLRLLEQVQPDVLLLDIWFEDSNGPNGLDVARQVCQRFPRVNVCILSAHAILAYVIQALRSGALGYVTKSADLVVVVRGVREVAAGRRFFSEPLSEEAIEAYEAKTGKGHFDLYETLTPCEREVFRLSALGLTMPEIAARRGVSPRTIESERKAAMTKLGLTNQSELVRYAVERGIIGNGSSRDIRQDPEPD